LKKSDAHRMDSGVAGTGAANYRVVQTAPRLFRKEYRTITETFIEQFRNAFDASHVAIQIYAAECIQYEPASQVNLFDDSAQAGKDVSYIRKSGL
jgi:hypothetical protein